MVNVTYNNFSNKTENIVPGIRLLEYQDALQAVLYILEWGVLGYRGLCRLESLGLLRDSTYLCIWLVGGENG